MGILRVGAPGVHSLLIRQNPIVQALFGELYKNMLSRIKIIVNRCEIIVSRIKAKSLLMVFKQMILIDKTCKTQCQQ